MVDIHKDAAGTSLRAEGRAVMVIKLYCVKLLFVGRKPFCAPESQQSLSPKGHKPAELWFPLQWHLDLGSAQESSSSTLSFPPSGHGGSL